VFRGNGDGTLAPGTRYPYGRVADVAVADVNRDGFLDVLAAMQNGSILTLLSLTDGNLVLTYESMASGFHTNHLVVADFTGDGVLDAVTSAADGPPTLYTGMASHPGRFEDYPFPFFGSDTATDVTAGDFDGDGLADFATANASDTITVVLSSPTGIVRVRHAVPGRAMGIRAADVNHDGRSDLVVSLSDGTAGIALLMNAGTAAGSPGHLLEAAPTGQPTRTFELTVTDLDRDGRPDVLAPCDNGDLLAYPNRCPLDRLTLAVNLVGTGGVRIDPAKPSYEAGERVTLVAMASPTYFFAGWSGDVAAVADSVVLVMDSAHFVRAEFPPILHDLDIGIVGQGSVDRLPAVNPIHEGTLVRLRAVPALGYLFGAWSGDTSSTSDTIGVTMDRAHAFIANFLPDPQVAPRILAVADVPDDQGGFVTLLWRASPFEFVPHDSAVAVTQYVVWKARTPALAPTVRSIAAPRAAAPGSNWVKVATVHAMLADEYRYVASTAGDSAGTSLPLSTFLVEAQDALGQHYWDSPPDSGYSIDNLAPQPPSGLQAVLAGDVATIRWRSSTESDLAAYHLHRGARADFVPSQDNVLASLTDTIFVDTHPAGSYYKLVAVDVHGNISVPAVAPLEGQALALAGVTPNPSRDGRCVVQVVLPSAAPASLVLIDVSGRQVAESVLRQAGRQGVTFGDDRRLRPGLYWVRLRQGSEERIGRLTILR